MCDHFSALGQKYIETMLSNEKDTIDRVYGVCFNDDGTMLGDKHIDMNRNDNMITDIQGNIWSVRANFHENFR